MQKFELEVISILVITHIGLWKRERERGRKQNWREEPSFVPGHAQNGGESRENIAR